MRRKESIKRIIVLSLSLVGLLLQTGVYAYSWFEYYAPIIDNLGNGIRLYYNGHILLMGIYFILLSVFSRTYGSLKIGYLKPFDVFFSQIFSLLAVNIVSYFQMSLMNVGLISVYPLLVVFALQLVIVAMMTYFNNWVYRRLFPPRKMLLVYGERPIEDILDKFSSRKDRYKIAKCVNISEGIEAIMAEITSSYGAVVLWDISTHDRNRLLKFCYSRSIRVYLMPKIPDVLIKGSDQMHLFDTPIFLTREYALTVEQRLIKRLIDLTFSALLLVITSPIMLLTAVAIRGYDRGPAFYKQVRCTAGGKEFQILKFRSMRVDAEKDGVARLATQNDDRITPIGRFIRMVRIDELPQLFNILKGEMSFIGPRPERPEIIAQYLEEIPEFVFRMKMKAGLAGYAQVYGKYNTTPYDKLKLDLSYIENYTIWLDLKLMLLTMKILFKPESTEGIGEEQVTAIKNEEQENHDQ
ncbi:MAG: sugar transferase [Lachnospiraceae bacterium]|nr:sugar transferase [Lachnospiraceae bacterium]